MPDFKKYNLMHSTNNTHTINYNILEMKNVSYHIRKKRITTLDYKKINKNKKYNRNKSKL